ncbi:MAG: hypothetical protein JWO77_2113 [Ilumatobacteraceae bacterium]|nr:hypothetical protein [Ilumatobacteraceae bacterium]
MTAPGATPEMGPGAPGDDTTSTPPPPSPPPSSPSTAVPARPSWQAALAWLVLAGVAVAIDGVVGGLAFVAIAAVLLAGLPTRLIGGLGVLLLIGAPIAIVIEGVPTDSGVSPAFVTRSLLPHHLAFAGLILVCAFALIDLAPHLRAWAEGDHPAQDDGPPFGTAIGVALVAAVAVGALVACWAVLGA